MPRQLKVYGGLTRLGPKQVRTAVAATSLTAAAKAVQLPVSYVRSCWSETWSKAELEVCLAAPGEVFFTDAHAVGERVYKPFPAEQLGRR